jgi:predicted RNA binding protein YcfA (HicA-like mRNA interferase family)
VSALPLFRPREVVAFEGLGWQIARQRGSHIVLTKPGSPVTLSVPDHPQVARGNLRALIAKAGLTVEEFLLAIDGSLKKISDYWHTGHLRHGQFATQNGKDRIFPAGVNNAFRSGTLVVFDPTNIHGVAGISADLPDRTPKFSLLSAGTKDHLSALSQGTETCRVLFERVDLFKIRPYWRPYSRVTSLTVKPDIIEIEVTQGERPTADEKAYYQLDRHLNIIEAYANSEFRKIQWEMEKAGVLDHKYSQDEFKPLMHIMPGCELTAPPK